MSLSKFIAVEEMGYNDPHGIKHQRYAFGPLKIAILVIA